MTDRRDAIRQVLMEKARADERAGRRGARRWRLGLLVPVFAIVIAGGAAAAAGWFTGELDDPQAVVCFAAADLGSRSEYVDTDFSSVEGEQPGDQTATALCAPYWRRGVFGDGKEVPPLIACVKNRQTAVLPGTRGTCAALGLEAVSAKTFTSQARRRAAFESGIDGLGLKACSKPADVRRQLLGLLERTGMAGWKVRVDGDPKCVAMVGGSYDKRELTISGDEDAEYDSFAVSAPIGGRPISQKEFREIAKRNIRRACEQAEGPPTDRVLGCLMARVGLGGPCVKVEFARAAVEPLVEDELGPRSRVVVKGSGKCFTGYEVNSALGELRLFAGPG
jgi:hypothetical protein